MVISKGAVADDESLASFFRRRFGVEAFQRLIEPLMAGIYAGDAEEMSIRATFPRFVELEQQYGSLLRGILASGPAKPSNGSVPHRTAFVTLAGGLGTLVDALLQRMTAAGVTVLTGQRVTAVRARRSRSNGTPYEVSSEAGSSVSADAVVLADPRFCLRRS